MTTVREAVYMVLDELKLVSDDAHFTEEHVIFLLKKFRAYVLKAEKERNKLMDAALSSGTGLTGLDSSEEDYQNITLEMQAVAAVPGFPSKGKYLKSFQKVPKLMGIGTVKVYAADFFSSEIQLVSAEGFKYPSTSAYTQKIVYAAVGPDQYLYIRSDNPQFLYLQNVNMRAVFDDLDAVADVNGVDILDTEFPISDSLFGLVLQYTVRELAGVQYKPADIINNARDDFGSMAVKEQ